MGRSGFLRLAIPGVLLAFGAGVLRAQTARINGSIDAAKVAVVSGSVSPRIAAATDNGLAPADKALGISLRFSMTDAQQQALTQLLTGQQDPASPRYHQWLTPEQFRAQFGLSDTDISKVTGWLASQGFTVTEVARSGTFVRFSGTVAQAQQAFGTEVHSVTINGESHFADRTAPSLPVAIAAVTSAITGLDDFRPKSHHVQQIVPAPGTTNTPGVPQPQFTSSSSGNHYLAPGDFYTIYDEKPLIASGVTGTGVTIAVMGQSDIYTADIAAFRSASGLAANTPAVKLYGADPGIPSSDDLVEGELDVEWAGAIAPGATILYVNAVNAIDGSLTEAIDNNLAPVISMSYGDCEPNFGASQLAYYSQLLQQAAAQGISITAASGDAGATDCDYSTGTATHGYAVDFPGSSPLVTSAGGTEFNEGSGTYWSATNDANGGSALSYVPEMVWNDDSTYQLSSSGGGRSVYFPKPAWQTGTGVPADFSRDVPDVSFSASPAHDPYLICTNGFCTSGFRNGSGYLDTVGGTSVTAPEFAGLLALAVQKTGGRIGNANPVIYALANSTYAANVFHDVTTGSNASVCATGSTDCASGGPIGFAATAKYDLATGWGSIDAYNLVNDWLLVTPVSTTTGAKPSLTNVSGSAASVAAGTTVTLTATVASGTTSSTSTPTGNVQFTVDNVAVGTAVPLSSGTATYSLNTTSLSSGRHVVQATYAGDTTYAGSKGAFALNITSATGADFTLTPSTATVTVASGKTAPGLVFTVAAVNGFTGSVQITASSATTFNAEYSFSTDPVVLTSTNTSGTTTLTLFAYASNAHAQGVSLAHAAVGRKSWYEAGAGTVLAALLLLVLPQRRRISALLALLLSIGVIGASGCASGLGGGSIFQQNTPTTPGTYNILVSATATVNGVSTTHTSTVTFIVQ